MGGFHPGPGDTVPMGTQTLVLLGPMEPGFWPHFKNSPEWADRKADPLDRWSARVIGALAEELGGTALFPFGGPPYNPFYSWALRSGRAFASPVQLLVHDTAGLMVSYRGALALPRHVPLPAPGPSPCTACAMPCATACPVGALSPAGYDVPACHAYLDLPEGASCLNIGCAVRLACPVSKTYARLADQSAYHMRLFHK
jgi:epoxyqueuosine reductase